MIFDTISSADKYAKLHPLFSQAFEYIRKNDMKTMTIGRHTVLEDQIFVIIQQDLGQKREAAKLECHRQYIDIQVVLSGVDEMGWKPLADCQHVTEIYNPAHDVQFFGDAPLNWLTVPANQFCIFFPEDAHSGMVSAQHIHKAVFKVAVNPNHKN